MPSRAFWLEDLVRSAYRVNQEIYAMILGRTPEPAIEWALRS